MQRSRHFLIVLLALSLTLLACGPLADLGIGGPTVTVGIVYGSEKEAWLEELEAAFNAANNQTASGARIVIEAEPMGSIESAEGIMSGRLQPVVWSPASSLYLPILAADWRQANGSELWSGDPEDLVLSPVVIAMWRPMAEALGWPQETLGWADIAALSTADEGWDAYGYPQWGDFKFGHTHPDYSNSGFTAIVAQAYAGAGTTRNLTVDQVEDPAVQEFMAEVQQSIIHYGRSTGFFGRQMFDRGPSYLSAAVMYENLVVEQESARLNGTSSQIPVVAIYPEEGTFWSNHPYVILDASWVTDEQKEAAAIFEDYLLARPQQERALYYGFRPADIDIPLSSPLDTDHGMDPSQPQTILEVPQDEALRAIQATWEQAKKPVDLVVVMDISGSMEGDKIASARSSLIQFIDLLGDRDRLQIILFDDEIVTMTPLTELGPKREEVKRQVSGIFEDGYTALYDAVSFGYQEIEASGDPDHIRAMVVLSDGADTASRTITYPDLLGQIGDLSEGGNATKVFTIAFGGDASTDILEAIASATGARSYVGDPATIFDVYVEISTFF